jgi:hypothetical protein
MPTEYPTETWRNIGKSIHCLPCAEEAFYFVTFLTVNDLNPKKEMEISCHRATNTTDSGNPFLMTLLDVHLHKALDVIINFLTMRVTKKRRAQMKPDTIDKSSLMILSQMASKEHPEDAGNWLSLIGISLYTFAEQLKNAGDQRDQIIEQFLKMNHKDKGATLFSVSATTINRVFDKVPKHDSDLMLSQQLTDISQRLRKDGLQSKDAILAIDPSDTKYTGNFHNQYTPWGFTGQKDTYSRGFKENMLYINPGSFIESSNLQIVQPQSRAGRDLPLWIQQCQQALRDEQARGVSIRLLEGDREFFKALGFAYSRFGLWDPTLKHLENPRFLCPKKVWDNSEYKWVYLLNKQAPILENEQISLEFYQTKFLEGYLDRLPSNRAKTQYCIPVVSVAVFDSYLNGHRPETMTWAHDRAAQIAAQIKTIGDDLKVYEKDYLEYLKKQQQFKYQSKCKTSATKKIQIPKYNGKRRTVFKDPEEKVLYRNCCRIYDLLQEWEKKKSKLCARLMFFYLSLYEGEEITGKEAEFSTLIREYHERWGIENGFKMIKYHFLLKTNCRGACARHSRWILSCMVYNTWHYWRLVRASRILKRTDPNWKPFDSTIYPPVRKKYERKMHPILTAQGYLLEALAYGIKDRIKKVIKSLI